MKRARLADLISWLESKDRTPLIIRGARQVGKTWLVRVLAEVTHRQLIELNFEKQPQLYSLFASNDPKQILLLLQTTLNITIDFTQAILFLDEIQAVPELISKLRWFSEDLPQLPVIAAGSLLDFVLAEHQFSMPVGRVSYLHLEPLSFEEFLLACQQDQKHAYIKNYLLGEQIPEMLHQQLLEQFKEYMVIGGMPKAVANWQSERSPIKVMQIHQDLIATYRDDFAKYAGKIPISLLDQILMAIPRMLTDKFIYSHVNRDVQIAQIKNGLSLLEKAKICHRIYATAANGLPLAAEIKEKIFKVIYLDVGLVSAALGNSLHHVLPIVDINFINQGVLSEQVVGQLLRTLPPYFVEPNIYYWCREEKNTAAEVDYLFNHYQQIIPVEVKSGSTGSLKSLHYIMSLKHYPLALRINSDFPSKMKITSKIHTGIEVSYELLSVPFYLIGQLPRLLG